MPTFEMTYIQWKQSHTKAVPKLWGTPSLEGAEKNWINLFIDYFVDTFEYLIAIIVTCASL